MKLRLIPVYSKRDFTVIPFSLHRNFIRLEEVKASNFITTILCKT